MSIFNKTWAVDEEITSDKLNQMSADANNSLSEIHPQYQRRCGHGALSSAIKAGLFNQGGSKIVETGNGQSVEMHVFSVAGDLARISFIHSFKISADEKSKVTVSWNESITTVGSGPFNQPTGAYQLYKNDTLVSSNSHNITGTASYSSGEIDISGFSAGDILTVEVYVNVPTANLPTNDNDGDRAFINKILIELS